MTQTIDVSMAEMPEPVSQAVGLVRGTTRRCVDLYGLVKNYSPLVRKGLETVEGQIPEPWIERIGSVSEPMIHQLDCGLDQLKKRVTENVISPVTRTVDNVMTPVTATYRSFDVDNDGVVSFSDVRACAGDKVGQWKSLRGDLTKKAVGRLEQGLGQVREFSATRGKDMIHFDLIAYSETVIGNASGAAKNRVEPISATLAAAVLKLNEAVASVQEAFVSKSHSSLEQIDQGKAELRARLSQAVQAARELSHTSVAYVQQRFEGVAQYASQEQLPQSVRDSIAFIFSSPQLFAEVKTSALNSKTMANVSDLMEAVRVVVFGTDKAASSPAGAEATAPEAEVEEGEVSMRVGA